MVGVPDETDEVDHLRGSAWCSHLEQNRSEQHSGGRLTIVSSPAKKHCPLDPRGEPGDILVFDLADAWYVQNVQIVMRVLMLVVQLLIDLRPYAGLYNRV